ncbi:MAG: hypothetical protein B7Z44_13970 [Caulobacter sp. 12-67-6]|nr:MAG: hypothetical protein B7Z44_13970 [Caulobacter sp. 12-67-6]OYX70829.1 MAG: hypothetical protein B7Y81_10895 [Caulobacter sp. 32-67-35]OYX92071.1 MAG: hypothetical protein B7Y78_10985 [Caulobacter sp. 35-67-4]OZA76449.1 MAG: hypothetical protein B7X77_05920 [Caulobacter sp. 39-67-4]HQR88068.1 hypothetical protein [Caulobacter sp.]
MTALACLRIFVGADLCFTDTDSMAALVAKVAGAYLETTWKWPRRYGLVAPFSFVLADPRAERLDARELQDLARALQHKLFGDQGDGDVTLLTFEGDQTDVMRFAGATALQLKGLLDGEDDGAFAGRVCKITPTDVSSVAPPGGPVAGEPPMEALRAQEHMVAPARTAYRGVFHTQREVFVGNISVWREAGSVSVFGMEPPAADASEAGHDIPNLESARRALEGETSGVMFFPISFSTLVKPSARAELTPYLETLPQASRARLAAAVYDTPRAPSFSALSQMKQYLNPFFGRIDLRVSDPAFQVDDLPPDLASSVTLMLPTGVEAVRLAAISRFMRDAAGYRRKRIWQGVTDVRNRREVNACIELGVPFITGPGVTDLLETPAHVSPCSALHLPLHDWSARVTGAAASQVA